jgi:hypothetical protein
MKGGAMQDVITTGAEEKRVAKTVDQMGKVMDDLREKIRGGERLAEEGLRVIMELSSLRSV